jgi:hypothetical protein
MNLIMYIYTYSTYGCNNYLRKFLDMKKGKSFLPAKNVWCLACGGIQDLCVVSTLS